ncbi:hypothetical protein HER10_EVM0007548 [Colletotrichum scovillei]|uniref:uncharacterized protein n=1 Tax=Colletotrichum scovillei TaxID=1209932 RepID=UPI0015C3A2BA|nr:uncharacterized protein HER10_EVM0007548 [Colletotrichum scovillei]KAF4773999.1 hypothetical protein HER10_EVM0007548 [Colletotrichum scovillei]
MATSHSGNAATSNRTSIGASATLPPWPTFNSTQASLTGTISIPVITSSTTVISNITASASASFPWTNSTSSGGLTASVMTASGGSTITLWPTGMTPSLTSSSNGTLLQTSTANATSSLTSSAASAPFPTYNSTQIPWPTAVNSSGMPPSTVYSGTAAITYTSIGSDRPPFPTTNSTKLPGPTGSGTWASGTLFQTSEPSETSNSTSFTVNLPPFPTTGNATAIPRPTWIPGTASGLPVTTLTATGANGSTTQTLSIVPLPPFLTFNDTATPGATGTSAGTGVSVTWGGTGGPFSAPTDSSSTWGQWPNSTASNMLSTISVPTTPSGTAPLPTPRNTTTFSGFFRHRAAFWILSYRVGGPSVYQLSWPSIWNSFGLQYCHCNKRHPSSAGSTRTWTSVDPTTTFITSTTSRLSNPSRDSSAIFNTSFSVAGTPTTTISNVPLPSSPAYPWGGLGPIFRHHSGTDPIDDDAGFPDGPVVQERNEVWWSRWKKHMDQLASRARARNRGA